MASEEQYLDDLLKNIIGDEPPKERTMQDVMREIGVSYVPEPETQSQTPDIDPDINISDPVSMPEDIPVDLSQEDTSNLTFPDQDVLADMLDILDNPASFANETQPAETTEDEISQMLEEVPGIIDEPVPAEEPTSVEDIVPAEDFASAEESDPLQENLESMLDGIEASYNAGEVEEVPTQELSSEDIDAMIAAVEGEPSEGSVEESVVETASQDELSAMLEGIDEGSDVLTDYTSSENLSSEDIDAMIAVAEGISASPEEAPTEEFVEDIPIEEPAVEVPVEEIPAEEPASQDDLAAMLAGMGGDDPNAKMSPDDIAAMFAAAEGATAAAEEAPVEEIPAEETVEDISIEEPAEEPAEEAPADESASQDDLAAMLEGMDGAEESPAEDGVMMSSDDELLKMLGEATTAEDFVMPDDRLAKTDEEAEATAESEGEGEIETPDTAEVESVPEIDEDNLSQSDIEALMAGEPLGMPAGDSQEDLEALLAMAGGDEETPAEESQDDLEAMLAAADEGSEEEASTEGNLSQDDLEAMLGGMDMEEPASSSEEMSDVEKLEATEGSDEDLLSLLEGIDDTPEEERGLDGLPDELSGVLGEEETDEIKPKKKKFSLLSLLPFGKKKKKGEEEDQANWDDIEGESNADQPIEAAAEQIDDILAGIHIHGYRCFHKLSA